MLHSITTRGPNFDPTEAGDDEASGQGLAARQSQLGPDAVVLELCTDVVVCDISYAPEYSPGAHVDINIACRHLRSPVLQLAVVSVSSTIAGSVVSLVVSL